MTNRPNEETEPFIGVEDAAAALGLSVHTLRKYAQEKEVPYWQERARGPLLFRRSEIEEWDRRRKEPKQVVSLDGKKDVLGR